MTTLPVSGFVLAGGLSSRMGADKALLEFCGRPMVEIAVETLREFCTEVAIAGNRKDLARFAPVVFETRVEAGPAAGVEAGLRTAAQPWAVFLPVDVPLVTAYLLRSWMSAVLSRGCIASYLIVQGQRQPVFCALRRECMQGISCALNEGERRLAEILRRGAQAGAGELWCCDAAVFASGAPYATGEVESLFRNINTPDDKAAAERWATGRTFEIEKLHRAS